MNALGIQLMLDLADCNPRLLDDLNYIKKTLIQAANEVGAHIIGESFHQFHPQGVTGILAIAESHFCIHTWPEFNYAAIDMFTCGSSIDISRASDLLISKLESKTPKVTELKRGIIHKSVVGT